MEELLARFVSDLGGRVSGPMSGRLLLQPAVAIVLAVIAGRADAKAGRPAYLWAVLTNPGPRRRMLRAGWKDVAKVFVMAILIDLVYQFIVFRWFYPNEAIVVAFVLACVPYLLVRGPVNRLLRASGRPRQEPL